MGNDTPEGTAEDPRTLPEALAAAARRYPERGIAIFDGRGRNVERRGYAELHAGAGRVAARLAARGVAAGEPVLIALPTSWDWMLAWFGTLLRGALPVATAGAGAMAAAGVQLDKLATVRSNLGARLVLASSGFRDEAVAQVDNLRAEDVVTIDELIAEATPAVAPPRLDGDADQTAFLQLTSGSTGVPRAVMISHRAALHNPLASAEAIGAPLGGPIHTIADAMVSWLPLYHDMGLIGCLVLPLLTGLDTWIFRPQTFLARPRLWLDHLGRHGATFVPAPNFGYQLCVERISEENAEGLDLSSWCAALTGAEMVRSETTAAFCDRFGPHGFDPRAFRPCYGLAEATLAVTFDIEGRGVRTLPAPSGADAGFRLAEVVSTGRPIRDTAVRIVAPDRTRLAEDAIGEVEISGPGILQGYYNDPEATAATLSDGWFATGDLGFLHDGELYLTGRTKDVLIVHGHNLMPEDLERIADGVTGGGGLARSAAFSVARGPGGEEAVLVVEIDPKRPESRGEMAREIRVRVGRTVGLPLADVAFVRRGRIPRTTSGKMRRGEVRTMYLEGTLERLDDQLNRDGAL